MTLAFAAMALALPAGRPDLLIHVMPWFEAGQADLGWHWKMNRKAEELRKDGRVASHYRPLIGAYDSLDPEVVELQVLWMKIAGFDGVLADWYGTRPWFDYGGIHERTKLLFDYATRAGLKISVVYEDQTVKHALSQKVVQPDEVRKVAEEVGAFLKTEWFPKGNFWRLDGKPAVMVFGPQQFQAPEWAAFRKGAGDYHLITLHKTHDYASGGYDWPIPSLGLKFNEEFSSRSKGWKYRIPIAFPRFVDWYEEGGQTGYPDLADNSGATYRKTLDWAIRAGGQAIQVATWNDWQEGTQIEPSVEFGMRDLVETQKARKRIDPSFLFKPADLDVPLRLYRLRKTREVDEELLDKAAKALFAGKVSEAKRLLTNPGG